MEAGPYKRESVIDIDQNQDDSNLNEYISIISVFFHKKIAYFHLNRSVLCGACGIYICIGLYHCGDIHISVFIVLLLQNGCGISTSGIFSLGSCKVRLKFCDIQSHILMNFYFKFRMVIIF